MVITLIPAQNVSREIREKSRGDETRIHQVAMGKRALDESVVSEADIAGPTTDKEEYEALCTLVSDRLVTVEMGTFRSTRSRSRLLAASLQRSCTS